VSKPRFASIPKPYKAYVISESRSALASAAPDSSGRRLRARFPADHFCMMEGNCAFTASILQRRSAAARWWRGDSSLRAVSAAHARAVRGRCLRGQHREFLLQIFQPRLYRRWFMQGVERCALRQRRADFRHVALQRLHHLEQRVHLRRVVSFRHFSTGEGGGGK
jgi:hypothetical protein